VKGLIFISISFKIEIFKRLNFPLVIFIHGGAYMAGSAADYMNEYVAEHYAAKGIIVAIVQYRLGVLGVF
jgi:carboxylesterase type B